MRRRSTGHPAKPGYSLTRQAFWISFVLAWSVVIALVWGAFYERHEVVVLAEIVVPSMVALIVVTLGVHRAFGAIDMRTLYQHAPHRPYTEQSEGGEM